MPDKNDPKRDAPKSPEPPELRQKMFEAYQLLHEAHINYSQALGIVRDTELSSDGMLAIQQKGRVYAEAVTRYTNAAMRWLALVETNREESLKLLRKSTAGDM